MAQTIRMGPPEILERLSREITATRARLAAVGEPHAVLDGVVPAGLDPMATGVRSGFEELRRVVEEAFARQAGYASGADRTLNLVAYTLEYVAVNFPATDQRGGAELRRLAGEATTAAPPPRDPSAVDPRFLSAPKPG